MFIVVQLHVAQMAAEVRMPLRKKKKQMAAEVRMPLRKKKKIPLWRVRRTKKINDKSQGGSKHFLAF